jgi:hypothetical protein
MGKPKAAAGAATATATATATASQAPVSTLRIMRHDTCSAVPLTETRARMRCCYRAARQQSTVRACARVGCSSVTRARVRAAATHAGEPRVGGRTWTDRPTPQTTHPGASCTRSARLCSAPRRVRRLLGGGYFSSGSASRIHDDQTARGWRRAGRRLGGRAARRTAVRLGADAEELLRHGGRRAQRERGRGKRGRRRRLYAGAVMNERWPS